MEKLRALWGDKTPKTGDREFESRLRAIRKRNGGNVGVFFTEVYEGGERWRDTKTGFSLRRGDAEYMRAHYSETPRSASKPIGSVRLVFQSREDFLQRFLK